MRRSFIRYHSECTAAKHITDGRGDLRDRAKECPGARENEKAPKEERGGRAPHLKAIFFRPGRFAIPGLPTASFLGRCVPHGSGVPMKGFLPSRRSPTTKSALGPA